MVFTEKWCRSVLTGDFDKFGSWFFVVGFLRGGFLVWSVGWPSCVGFGEFRVVSVWGGLGWFRVVKVGRDAIERGESLKGYSLSPR